MGYHGVSYHSCPFHSIRIWGRAAFLVFGLAALGSALHGESRRAILVGIDNYNPDAATQAQLLRDLKPPTVKRPAVEGDAKYWRFDDLDGAVNDVRLMKAVLQSLGFQDFVVLTDQDATADAILQALQKNLVDDAQPGDVRLFYYSGHGNHVKNRASTERQQEDQTLVPADNWRNVPDIRDKEISRILFNAARKGVIVTLIADSCHSGSLARGAWNSSGKARTNSGVRAGTPGATLHEPVANDPARHRSRYPPAHRSRRRSACSRWPPPSPTRKPARCRPKTARTAPSPGHWPRRCATPPNRWTAFSPAPWRLWARTAPSNSPPWAARRDSPRRSWASLPAAGGGLTVVVDSVKGADIHLRGGAAIGLFPQVPPQDRQPTAGDR